MSNVYVMLVCDRCGDEYERHANQAESSRYCSQDCRYNRNDDVSADVSRHGHEWSKQRQKALNRDNHQCRECGCEVGREHESVPTAHVHHETSINNGGTHSLENLTTLCETCHHSGHGDGSLA